MAFETCTQVHGRITTSASVSCGVHVSSVAKLETGTRIHAGGKFDLGPTGCHRCSAQIAESFRTEGWGRAVFISTEGRAATTRASTVKIREMKISLLASKHG
jgi:hypothetical protein